MGMIYKNNKILNSPYYPTIVAEYNEEVRKTGNRVVEKKFWKEHVATRVNVGYDSWRQICNRFATHAGLVQAHMGIDPSAPPPAVTEGQIVMEKVSAPIAIQRGILAALNIGASTMEKILSGNTNLNDKEKAELLFKAMKAQDSRINAIARLKKDRREEVVFEKVFGEAAYNDGNG